MLSCNSATGRSNIVKVAQLLPLPQSTQVDPKMKDFFKASLRTAAAIFLALIGVAIAVGIYSWAKNAYDRQQAKPFEDAREWRFSLKNAIDLETKAKTKLVASTLLVSVEVIGYPKYLSDPRNLNGYLIFEFLDKDDFKIISKPVKISEFTAIVGKGGEKIGLVYQFEEYTDLERYKRFDRMQVGWKLATTAVPKPMAATPKPIARGPTLDHCAPDISKNERLERLAQYGTVRQTGENSYSASSHTVHFTMYGSLLLCY